jgi:hypothetical protein
MCDCARKSHAHDMRQCSAKKERIDVGGWLRVYGGAAAHNWIAAAIILEGTAGIIGLRLLSLTVKLV